MGTRTRNTQTATRTPNKPNLGMLAKIAAAGVKSYGTGAPKYKLVDNFGMVPVVNTLETAFQGFAECKRELGVGEAGISHSQQYDGSFSAAIRMEDGGITFASLLHDDQGEPVVETELQVCLVRATEDIVIDGEVVVAEGKELLKALPKSYVAKLQKA